MPKKRFFEYFHNHPESLIPKIVRELYEIVVRPSWLRREEEFKNKSAELLRQSLYLNRLRIESEQRLEELMELVETSNQLVDKERKARLILEEELEQTKTAWSQQYDLVQKLRTELAPRIFQIQRRIYDSRTPRIWADLSGTIQITNLPRRYGLIGQNINEYFFKNQFPDTGTRTLNDILSIIAGKRVYRVKEISNSYEDREQIGTMVRLEKIKGRDLRETKEGLLEKIQGKVEQFRQRRHRLKPQET